MRNNKLLTRLLCGFLSVLMLLCLVPALTVGAAEDNSNGDGSGNENVEESFGGSGVLETTDKDFNYAKLDYGSVENRLKYMTEFYNDGQYALYCDVDLGVVAYRKLATGETLFTNPWDLRKEISNVETVLNNFMSQVNLTYIDSQNVSKTLTSYADAVLKGQMSVRAIKNGVRVEYAMGNPSARTLVPMRIEQSAFEEKILAPMRENMPGGAGNRDYLVFNAYYSLKRYVDETNEAKKEAIALAYPVCEKKDINIYVMNETNISTKQLRQLESYILAYCPDYTFEEMDNDYELVEFEEEAVSPPVFRLALEYTIDANGLSVSLPANGLRYDETTYRVTEISILPFMGASYKGNPKVDDANVSYSGYSFIPDGSGTLYALNTNVSLSSRVYGEDYALLSKVSGLHNETMRMPVYGQVSSVTQSGKTVSSGYLAIIEEGESIASIAPSHGTMQYSTIIPSFSTRQFDTSKSGWQVYAARRFTEDYRLRYIILTDDAKAEAANLPSYYECSWMGMACAYRDYLDAANEGFNRLTDANVEDSIPLYIETFGCVDTIEKVMSIPVTVSVALTSFEDLKTMYDYLAGEGVKNVNFKLSGYANGGLYSDVPYKLKWEKSVGGKGGFKELLKQADELGFGVYPDFDFVYTKSSDAGSKVSMKKHAARTIDNRYTSKRVYSATQQSLVSYFQMVMSPAMFSHFYEKLESRYSKYGATGISLSTFGSALNSDFDEDKTTLREEAKTYTIEALQYFQDKNYDVMVDGGNAFTWAYVDHILRVPLDSSRYTNELYSVPFMGVVLHGYVQFAGSPLNMEGNLKYAMLKAMENGAGIYFILSYANTELLKEDVLLSQNYSVRYDIWQKRLVEIYQELNAVLYDVQTKLIIDHEFLDATRVPDQDELLQDIIDEANKQQAAIENKIQREKNATAAIAQASLKMSTFATSFTQMYAALNAQRFAIAGADTELITAWKAAVAEAAANDGKLSAATVVSFTKLLSACVAEPYAKLENLFSDAEKLISVAKGNYNNLLGADTDEDVLATARDQLSTLIDNYFSILQAYHGVNRTYQNLDAAKAQFIDDSTLITAADLRALTVYEETLVTVSEADLDAFLFGDFAFENGSVNAIFDAYTALLKKSVKNIDLKALAKALKDSTSNKIDTAVKPNNGVIIGNASTSGSKYTIDSSVVLVTYGEDMNTPYKSLILNFNDYAVQVTVNGVTYTVGGYEYIILMHN
ncbi:MAG: hypothetical protein E7644_00285 [Ruminococcaceae bacterium]|nr:hypothetical protein [Oscillospiraceae bacterium]